MPRELKSFTIETASSFPKQTVLKALDARTGQTQASLYVLARTKKDAIARLSKHIGYRISPSTVREGRGAHVEAVVATTGFYDDEGAMLAMLGNGGQKVAVERGGEWFSVGETTYSYPGGTKSRAKPVFVLNRSKARVAMDSTPAAQAKPVRITIELDVDTDPELAEKLIAGMRCRVTFGRITARDVVGKVVQP